jgi:hypothetical protein
MFFGLKIRSAPRSDRIQGSAADHAQLPWSLKIQMLSRVLKFIIATRGLG